MSTETTEAVLPRERPVTRTEPFRLHPGWIILAIASAGVYMSAPGQSYSVAAFLDPMLADLKILRTEYSLAYLVATLMGGLTLPWMGRRLDDFGARKMLPTVALLLGIACLWMGSIHHIAALYVGFAMIRCLGQGTLTLTSSWMIGEWFEQRRGLATGLIGLGGTLSVMSVPQINNYLIVEYGWRNAWLFLAGAVWIVLILPGILMVRDRPEDEGLLPDLKWPKTKEEQDSEASTISESVPKPRSVHITDDSWTVNEARGNSTFWKLLAVLATSSMVGTGLVFHQVDLLGEHGVLRNDALFMLGIQAAVGTVSSLLFGYLTDRVQARYLMSACMLFLAIALGVLIVLPSPKYAFVYAGLLGLQGGVIRSTGTVVWINYYGRLHQGAVRGLAMSFMVAAAAFGPLPLALAKDQLGSYRLALCCFLIMPILAAIAVLTAKMPVKQRVVESV